MIKCAKFSGNVPGFHFLNAAVTAKKSDFRNRMYGTSRLVYHSNELSMLI